MPHTLISEEVDLYVYPQRLRTESGAQITLGDLHGNCIKLLFVLLKHGIADGIDESEYQRLVKIYKKKLTPHKKGLEYSQKYINEFICLVNKLHFNPDIKIRLLGDELADRGSNDLLTLILLQVMREKDANLEIVYSNHGLWFLQSYAQDFKQSHPGGHPSQYKSLSQLEKAIDLDIVSLEEVQQIVTDAYFPVLKLISYSLNHANDEISIFSHAPIEIAMLKALSETFGVDFDDTTASALAQTIDALNEAFQTALLCHSLAKLIEPESMVYDFVWNRHSFSVLNRYSEYNDYQINYIHGHDDGGSQAHHIFNMNNYLGFKRWHQGEYTCLYSQDEHALEYQNSTRFSPIFITEVKQPILTSLQKQEKTADSIKSKANKAGFARRTFFSRAKSYSPFPSTHSKARQLLFLRSSAMPDEAQNESSASSELTGLACS